MKKIFSLCVMAGVLLLTGGCASMLMSMLGGAESPRPKEYQVEASKDLTVTNVAEIMKGQTGKQEDIKAVAIAAFQAMGRVTVEADNGLEKVPVAGKEEEGKAAAKKAVFVKSRSEKSLTPHEAEAISNIFANAAQAIKDSDGSAKLLSELSGRANKSIETGTLEYLAYAAGQTAVAMRNQEQAYQGIKAGWQWTNATIAKVAGGATGAGGLLAFALSSYRKMRSKDKLLKSTGAVINEYAAQQPTEGVKLKAAMAKAAAKLPVDAKKEFGV